MQVTKGGLFTTIQDDGRRGYRNLGIPQSGAMDVRAQQAANWLVGNSPDAPVLECSFLGGSFRFEKRKIIAITGADMNAQLNGAPCEMYRSHEVKPDDVLMFGYARAGTRTYVAAQGMPDIEEVMGSYSTYTAGRFGGFQGRTLQAGDSFDWGSGRPENPNRTLPEYLRPHFSIKKNIIRVVRGPEWKRLAAVSQKALEQTAYTIQADSNRMGIRLAGKKMEIEAGFSMVSSATLLGTVQLPPNGQAIVLMNDGQTTGGYPRIGKVIDADLGRLAQIPSQGSLHFRIVNEAEARQLFLYENRKRRGSR